MSRSMERTSTGSMLPRRRRMPSSGSQKSMTFAGLSKAQEILAMQIASIHNLEDEPFVKFCIVSDKGLMLEARHELDQYFDTVNDSNKLPLEIACEGVIPGLSKATGIRRAVDYLGESMDGTVGIGDGDNDMEMVQQCRMGIAMGNADEKLKQIADYVTADILDDGIAKAIEHAMEVLS